MEEAKSIKILMFSLLGKTIFTSASFHVGEVIDQSTCIISLNCYGFLFFYFFVLTFIFFSNDGIFIFVCLMSISLILIKWLFMMIVPSRTLINK